MSTSNAAFDPFACAECGERYSADCIPAGLSCGHTLCTQCADAITLCTPPTCTVCKAVVAAKAEPNPALAAFCDGRDSRWNGGVRHQWCETDEALAEKAASFTRAAAAAEEAAELTRANAAAVLDSAEAAEVTVTQALERRRAQLEDLGSAEVAAIRKLAADGLKQLDVECDELLVRASQLRAAAALCRAATGRSTAAAQQAFASLQSFETLACKPAFAHAPRTIQVAVAACEAFDRAWLRASAIDRRVRSAYILAQSGNTGLALSPDGSQFAVSNAYTHSIAIYSTADGELIRAFGGKGTEPGKFNWPRRLAYHPRSGNILVADSGNHCAQEVTPLGRGLRRFAPVGAVRGIACTDALVAVGKADFLHDDRVVLYDYSSGKCVRAFGCWGDGVGDLRCCVGMRFTADGRHLVVANGGSFGSYRLTRFTVDGTFVNEVGRGDLVCAGDVALLDNGTCLVCDQETNRMVVLPADDRGGWDEFDLAAAQFSKPVALAQSAGGGLFVLECSGGRVQFFPRR